jgi:selenocysteine lyase/cysteine desulfurase
MPEDPMTPPPADAGLDVRALREREFPLLASDVAYLNAASVTPLPERSRRALEERVMRRARIQELSDEDFGPALARCRELAAQLVGADAGEIALGGNTSYGINLAAQLLPLAPGSCIVASDREFPANVYPWMAAARQRGVRFELVPADALGRPDEARLIERLERGDVSLFALSAVQFTDGYAADLERFGRLCRERGIHFVVDAIQAAGHLPLDVRAAGIDILATGGHKWLLGPFGTGFAYVRRELIDRLEPHDVGWTAMQASADLSALLDYRWALLPDARRFEVATPPFHDYAALGASLELLLEVGIDRIRAHVLALLDPLIEWLSGHEAFEIVSDTTPAHRSGILSFRTRDAHGAFEALTAAGVVCSLREGAIRVAPHLYNTTEEMETVIAALSQWTGGSR